MLFTTAAFACAFLPIVLLVFFAAPGPAWAAGWLFAASMFFYGVWMPQFTLLLATSIVINFVAGRRICACVDAGLPSRGWLWAGVVFDLALLAYFKYCNFFLDNVSALVGTHWAHAEIVLPIGISFFTFTQIAFLVDASRGKVHDPRFVHYGLFVTYFPHLIAGPILHHEPMMRQFADSRIYRFNFDSFTVGAFIFSLGLLKKVVLADGVSPYADAVFVPVDAGAAPSVTEAWLGAMAYTLQLYFDFSGYSDMAIGLSKMFNIELPINFNSPYRATSIIEFWRRWHISLSSFLRDYLYVALGGNRHGAARRYANLMATMVLGGLWHGASWSFVFWGTLHGIYLIVNHGFRTLFPVSPEPRTGLRAWLGSGGSWLLTMLCVVVAWVFFRAETFGGALRMLDSMIGRHAPADSVLLWNAGLAANVGIGWCAVLGMLALIPFNSHRIGQAMSSMLADRGRVRAAMAGMASTLVLLFVLINTSRQSASAFIYFNF
jgi:alginate O-acetyltransferase complex protein AlgI